MNDINTKRIMSSLTTPPIGTTAPKTGQEAPKVNAEGKSFDQLLRERMLGSGSVDFSKHAVQRAQQREIPISAECMQRLDAGVKIAQEKGLNDTLILVDKTAFIVNVRSNKVITTVDGDALKGNVFTNIDGTVII